MMHELLWLVATLALSVAAGVRFRTFAEPFPLFLPSVNGSRPAKLQVVDALFDEHRQTRIAFIVKDPSSNASDRLRAYMYKIPADARCVFPDEQTPLVFGYTAERHYPGGDVWLCDAPKDLSLKRLEFRLYLGHTGAFRLHPSEFKRPLDSLKHTDGRFSPVYEVTKVGPSEGFGQRPVRSTMCIKPVYNTRNILYKLPVFVEHHLALGIDHFVFYKQPEFMDALTVEGMSVLSPYLRRGVLTVLELHPHHGDSGIATEGVYDGGDPLNAEELVGTHCLWYTRGLSQWTFVHVDIDEFLTPIPFDSKFLATTLDGAKEDRVEPPYSIRLEHLRADVPTAPESPLEVRHIQSGRDSTWGKCCYRPELVHVAWVHASGNNEATSPDGVSYVETSMGKYMSRGGAYFLHFSASHWQDYHGKSRPFRYPQQHRDTVAHKTRISFLY